MAERGKPGYATRKAGYDAAWRRLSKTARRLQPFCLTCGTTEGLTTDHTAEAWARRDRGLVIRLQDVQVLCGRHNISAGPGRGRRQEEQD